MRGENLERYRPVQTKFADREAGMDRHGDELHSSLASQLVSQTVLCVRSRLHILASSSSRMFSGLSLGIRVNGLYAQTKIDGTGIFDPAIQMGGTFWQSACFAHHRCLCCVQVGTSTLFCLQHVQLKRELTGHSILVGVR